MTLFTDVAELRRQRAHEMALLHTRIVTIADVMESEPAHWVGEHPYLATAGAAALGFVAAQLPSRRKVVERAKPRAEPPKEAPSPEPRSSASEILLMLANLAAQFLQPEGAGAPAANPESEPGVRVANAGSVTGDAFPGGFGRRDKDAG